MWYLFPFVLSRTESSQAISLEAELKRRPEFTLFALNRQKRYSFTDNKERFV